MNQQLNPQTLPVTPSRLVISAITRSARLPFLVLTPVCVFLGVSSAIAGQASLNISHLILILLGALMAHISVNTLNEYHDFKSGLDFKTRKTPFSGGSSALPDNPEQAHAVLKAGIASLTCVIVIGLFFIWQHGLAILPIGLIGTLLIIYYTGWINRHPILCLISPGLGFGVLMVLGSQFLLQGEYSTLAALAAIVPFCLVNNLLLLNQYPDIEADAEVGRHHLPIAFGIKSSNQVYAGFSIASVTAVILCVITGYFSPQSLITLIPMPLAFFALTGATKHGASIGHFPKYLAANTAVAILSPLLLAVSLLVKF